MPGHVARNTPIRRKWRRRVVILAALLLAGWLFHASILRGLATGLIVEDRLPEGRPLQDQPAPEPVVMLLDGDRQFDLAAQLYDAGAATILIYRSRPNRLVRMGIMPPGDEMARRELLKRGVSNERCEILAGTSSRRASIAVALTAWLKEHPNQTATVLCDRFTSRTWNVVLKRAAQPDVAERIRIAALPNRRFDESNWWRSKPGTLAFLNSFISLGFHYWHAGDEQESDELTAADFRAALAGGSH